MPYQNEVPRPSVPTGFKAIYALFTIFDLEPLGQQSVALAKQF
jgi:hypothetical protein